MIRVAPAGALVGHVAPPGDPAISHLALLIGAIAEGETEIAGFGRSAETEVTIAALRALGVEIADRDVDELAVSGVGLRGLTEPDGAIDCGRARSLLAGILAAQDGRRYELRDDGSLDRVAAFLRAMGASIEATDDCVVVEGRGLQGARHEPGSASADVKPTLLLAGALAREGTTTVVEPEPTPDHAELLLTHAGARVSRRGNATSVEPAEGLRPGRIDVPGDFSAGAPLIAAATLLSGSELYLRGVGINATRTGFLDVLVRMGARISVFNRRRLGREPVADVEIRQAPLTATTIEPGEVPRLVGELPLVALVAGSARGETIVRGVSDPDLNDRLSTALRGLGVRIRATADGFRIRGVPTRPKGGSLRADGDHRLAIVGAVAGLVSREGVAVEGAEAAAISFPGFFDLIDSVSRR